MSIPARTKSTQSRTAAAAAAAVATLTLHLGRTNVEALEHIVPAHLDDLLGVHADARQVRQGLEGGAGPGMFQPPPRDETERSVHTFRTHTLESPRSIDRVKRRERPGGESVTHD